MEKPTFPLKLDDDGVGWRQLLLACTNGTITEIELSGKDLFYPIPSSICDLTNLTKIDLKDSEISSPFPINHLSKCSNLQYLDISQNNFSGRLPSDINRLSSLRYFYLSGNSFDGDIPPAIGHMSNLIDLQLDCNPFKGSVPSEIGNLENIEILVLDSFLMMPQWRIPPEFGLLKSLKNLRIMNSNLKSDAKLEKEFQAEVEIMGRIRHANIVKLLCCISSQDSKILVYEYMENGSLDRWLYQKRNGTTIESGPLDWPIRLRIAVDAAQGLCYMHHSCSPPIIHRDVKSSNITFDSEFQPGLLISGLPGS